MHLCGLSEAWGEGELPGLARSQESTIGPYTLTVAPPCCAITRWYFKSGYQSTHWVPVSCSNQACSLWHLSWCTASLTMCSYHLATGLHFQCT